MEVLKAVGGFLLLMAAWLAVQAYLRRQRGCAGRSGDALEDMVHGCGACHGGGTCSGARHREEAVIGKGQS